MEWNLRWAEQGETITEGSFPIKPEDGYFRITVVDYQGHPAYTNACFAKDRNL